MKDQKTIMVIAPQAPQSIMSFVEINFQMLINHFMIKSDFKRIFDQKIQISTSVKILILIIMKLFRLLYQN